MTSNCSSPCHYVEPCVSIFPSRNIGSSDKHRVRTSTPYRSSGTFRPLQQIYKTVYSPSSGNNSSPFTSACICRPAERYKTANMTYGSFHYNNWKFMQKNRPVNCVQSFKTAMNSSGICNSEVQNPCAGSNRDELRERQYWSQPTSDACCFDDALNSSPQKLSNCCNY